MKVLIIAAVMLTGITGPEYSHTMPASEIDKNLRITSPQIGSKVNGKIRITGTAKGGSEVLVTIHSTYYKLGTNQQQRKMYKGEGPVKGATRTVRVKTSVQGFWKLETVNFRNEGWSTSFKIVAKSVKGGNATYVTVVNETRPVIAWD